MQILAVDWQNPSHCDAHLRLLNEYALSAMGGGQALSAETARSLAAAMRSRPHVCSALAWVDGVAVGLVNCVEGFSSFKAKPILNIHDIAVSPSHQGQGVGVALLDWAEQEARRRGCCKLTLEVLEGNERAQTVYRQFGFAAYELDPKLGQALFWEKPLATH